MLPQNSIQRKVSFIQTALRRWRIGNTSIITKRPTYLDNQATTPVDPRVLDKMLPMFVEAYGNPHSRTHAFGWEAEDLAESARKHVGDLIGATAKEIIFTSGATECNNMAIKGLAAFLKKNKGKKHVITTQIEHKCVLASCRYLEENGWDVTYLPVGKDGLVDIQKFEEAIRPDTAFASVMHVNNEIGVVQPMAEIGKICRKKGILLHTDAAQGVGKVPINVNDWNVDLMSISGHKLYGPKGVGALFIRSKPRVRIEPLIHGGGQERGLRSGTLPAPLAVGLGEACRIAGIEMERDRKHIQRLSKRLMDGIMSKLEDVTVNGSLEHRYYGNMNISFAFVEGESLLMSLPQFALSSGSACTSASLEPSYVLRAIGVGEDLAHTSLRFGIGRFTTEEEIDAVVKQVTEQVLYLREMSPLYDMAKNGEMDSMVWT
eukprot:GHVP01054218.1.p1 GENE.GHVP01054218.1~~GHVP01054218.1.p1  ORF type:complete len:432 (+),score=59.56 GHVP01054218.1:21-1316(+)